MSGARSFGWRLVVRKELADLLGRLGTRPLTRTLGVVAVFGLLVPLRFSSLANLPAFFALFMSFLPARLVAIDAFAGERERGTLENLLASPLTDRDIWLGKLLAATAYGAARGWLFVAVWLPAASVLRGSGLTPSLAAPSPTVVTAALAGALVVAYAAAVFGLWQSAAAPSVRAIVETGGAVRLLLVVTVFFVVPWFGGLLAPGAAAPTSASAVAELGTELARRAPGGLLAAAVVIVVAAAVTLACLTAASARRARREVLALAGDEPVRRLPHNGGRDNQPRTDGRPALRPRGWAGRAGWPARRNIG